MDVACLLIVIMSLWVFTICGNQSKAAYNLVKLNKLIEQYHKYTIERYFHRRQDWKTSETGTLLFKNKDNNYSSKNRTFLILYWKYWNWVSSRYRGDPFDKCEVKNCRLTIMNKDMLKADAIIIHVQHGFLPHLPKRRSSQRWIFMSDESPVNVFSVSDSMPTLSEWANVFNWTMTYRSDSDVPIPYGRTIPRAVTSSPSEITKSITNRIPNWREKRRDVYVAILISDCCARERLEYLEKLQQYIKIDVYGKCSKDPTHIHSCPGRIVSDCPVINNYLFYLAFENSMCRQYISEKTYYNSYLKGSIPIIMGAPKEDCEKLLPPLSFLHVSNYPHPKYLAKDVQRIVMNDDVLLMYHGWRRFFDIINEHGYFSSKSSHLCRVCEALNYSDNQPKVYDEDDLRLFFDPKLSCYSPFTVYRHGC